MASGEMIMDISSFRGLDQSESGTHKDIRTSPDMENFIIDRGMMMTAPGASRWKHGLIPGAAGVTTIMEAAFHREDGTTEYRVIAGAGGNLYSLRDGAWSEAGSGYTSDRWDAINYRSKTDEWHIVTNGADPVQYSTKDGVYAPIEGVPARGKYIAMLDERLWLGGVPDDQEVVYWSWDNDPTNWAVDTEFPEQGGGFIYIRTYDGTKVKAVKALMNDVVIFKDRSMHRITGSYPGEYELVNVYGSTGPISENTIVANGASVYFLCGEGLCVYDGMTVQTLALAGGDNRLIDLAGRFSREHAEAAASVIYRDTMYVALPIDGSETNNAVLVWDMTDNIYTLMTGYRVDSWLVHHTDAGEELLFARDGEIMIMDGDENDGAAIDARWVSPWFDAGSKSARKTSGRIYMTIEAKSMTGDLPKIKITMESEKKIREKVIEIKRPGVNVIRPRVKLRGRILRMKLETVDGCRLTIRPGVNIRVENDED